MAQTTLLKRKSCYTVVQNSGRPHEWVPILKAEATALFNFFDDGGKFFEPQNLTSSDSTCANRLTELASEKLEPRLSEISSVPYAAASQEEVDANAVLFDGLKCNHFNQFVSNTTVVGASVGVLEPQSCMAAYLDVLKKLDLSGDAKKPASFSSSNGETYSGGFLNEGYRPVNVAKFDKAQQDSCVFALKNKAAVTNLSRALLLVTEKVAQALNTTLATQFSDKNVTVSQGETHLVFGFNPHAHFNYHQDAEEYDWSVTIQLSPGKSSLAIAGFEQEVDFNGCGAYGMFPAQAYHRSGTKERRTLTATIFFKEKPNAPNEAGPSGVEKEEVKVKAEPPTVPDQSRPKREAKVPKS